MMLPVTINGREICRAVYNDSRYSFYLPERLESLFEKRLVTTRLVFRHPLRGESYAAREDAEIVRIQIEAEPDLLGVGNENKVQHLADQILEI